MRPIAPSLERGTDGEREQTLPQPPVAPPPAAPPAQAAGAPAGLLAQASAPERREDAGALAGEQDAKRGSSPATRVLVVERGEQATSVVRGLAENGAGPIVTSIETTAEALEALVRAPCDCVVVGPGIAKAAAFRLLEQLGARDELRGSTFIMFPDRPLTEREAARLRRLAATLTVKVVDSAEELTAAAAIALHRGVSWRAEGTPAGDAHDAEVLRGRKVLLVDDDVRNLFALASLLEDRGMEVVFGETGKEALSALERHQDIDIVLMDIMMPDMDGNETIAAIRKTPGLRELPIVAVTAKAMEGDRQRSLDVGASDYITKPVEPERLLSLIGTWLRR
jgi:CheY-like chemotaxis protein